MVNKLRLVSAGGGITLLLATAWATVHYGPSVGYASFLWPLVVAVAVLGLPQLLAHGKLWWHNARQWWETRGGFSFERGSLFLSAESVDERTTLVDDVVDAVQSVEEYDDVRRDEFPEGLGLTVTHAGFHNSFMRITRSGRVLVTGASERSRDLAKLLESRFGLTMERTRFNPFLEARPVKGAPRVFLGLFLVALLIVGTVGIGGAAYQTQAYNPAEKVVLVGLDARADAPGIDDDQVRLQKAAFLVSVVEEEAVEIQWAQNSSERVETHSRQAVLVSEDADRLLNETRERGDAAERQRAAELRADLREAEATVAMAIADRNTGSVASDNLTRIRSVLLNRSSR